MALRDTALKNAKAQSLKAADVHAMDMPEIAVLCGTTLGAVPKPFWGHKIKRYVRYSLRSDEDAAEVAEKRTRLRNKIRTLPQFAYATVVPDIDAAGARVWIVKA